MTYLTMVTTEPLTSESDARADQNDVVGGAAEHLEPDAILPAAEETAVDKDISPADADESALGNVCNS